MPTPFERYQALSEAARRLLHLRLAEQAEEIWRDYVDANNMKTYVETVVGSLQTIDRQLPADAIEAVRRGIDHANVASRYREPINALQDDDVSFGERGEYAYYAVYNLFRHYLGQQKDHWLIVNQALSAQDEAEAGSLLSAYLKDLEGERSV